MPRDSRFSHPLDVVKHPDLEPEVKRAILASWASDRAAIEGKPALRQPRGASKPIHIDEIFQAMDALDGGSGGQASARQWRPARRHRRHSANLDSRSG